MGSAENMALGQRIKQRRVELDMTQGDIASQIGVAVSTIQRYEAGTIDRPKLPVIEAIANAISVSPEWLIGKTSEKSVRDLRQMPANITPLSPMDHVPLLGQIACGTPILAEENITDYVDLPGHIRADYALTCKGDSMVNAGIQDGDIVYIRQQVEVENGQIAAVIVDEDEATLKRFYFDGEIIQLVAENPRIAPLVFSRESIGRVRVIGLAVAYTHMITV